MALFFTYGNPPLLAAHLPAVPGLVSRGLPCTSAHVRRWRGTAEGETPERAGGREGRREDDERLQLGSRVSGPSAELQQNCKGG